MKSYIVSEQDLMNLCKKAYDSGFHGYMDLQISTCESIVNEFTAENEHKLEKKISNQIYGVSDFSFTSYGNFDGSTYVITSSMNATDFV